MTTEIMDIETDTFWLYNYQQQLRYIATALCSAGIFYLLAANWFYLPHFVQLYIPQLLLLLSCIAASHFQPTSIKGQCAATSAAIMTGLSLATYSQIYQTGADSYQFFTIWTLLLLPWFYYRLSSVYTICCITSLLALLFANNQLFFLPLDTILLFCSALLLIQIIIAEYYFQAARFFLLLIIACIAFISIFLFFINTESWWIQAILLPTMITILFYFRGWSTGIAVGVLILAIITSAYIVKQMTYSSFKGTETFFFIALLLFSWCYGISHILQRLLPKEISLSMLPAAFGGWISSLFFTGGIAYLLIKYNDIQFSLAIFGLFLLISGLIGLTKTQHIFARQMFYTVTLSGQICLFIGIYDIFNDHPRYTFIATQSLIMIGSWMFLQSQFWRSLQLAIFVTLCYFYFPSILLWLVPILFIIWQLFPKKIADKHWRHPLLIGLYLLVFFSLSELFSYFHHDNLVQYSFLPTQTTQIIYATLVIVFLLLQQQHLPMVLLITFIALALLLIVLQQYQILFLLSALAVLAKYQHNFMHFLLMMTMALCLWFSYYNLSATLIVKASIIIATGLAITAVSMVIGQQLATIKQDAQ